MFYEEGCTHSGDCFLEIIDRVIASDGVLWAFGLFVLAISSPYMRFSELISECEHSLYRNKCSILLIGG